MTASPRILAYVAASFALWLCLWLAWWQFATVQAAPPPVEACELWRTAGGVPVYRCVDEEQYIVCYSQGVMLFCVPQQ